MDVLKNRSLKSHDSIVIVWMVVANAAAFVAFAYDKWCAKRSVRRVPEMWLVLLGAAGGWLGGLLGMKVFHHKTAKWLFKIKYGLALIPCAAEIWLWLRWR